MKKSPKLIAVVGTFVVVLPFVVRFGMVQMTRGGGSYVASPDGRLKASASSLHGPKFWGGERWWIEYAIVEQESGDPVFTARYAVRGDCRYGDVTWEVRHSKPTPQEQKRLEREAELLGNDEPGKLAPVHVVTFQCGPELTLTSYNAVDFFVCETCPPRVDWGQLKAEAGQ